MLTGKVSVQERRRSKMFISLKQKGSEAAPAPDLGEK